MVMPTMAIALVRFSSVVRSATSARITEPTAPAPCSTRPKMTPPIEVESAATALPMREQDEADDDHRLAPEPVGQQTEGDLQQPLAQPVNAERLADQIGGRARKVLGIGGKHRIDHEQAEQPDREDRRERAGGAEFLSSHRIYSQHMNEAPPASYGFKTRPCPAALIPVNCGGLPPAPGSCIDPPNSAHFGARRTTEPSDEARYPSRLPHHQGGDDRRQRIHHPLHLGQGRRCHASRHRPEVAPGLDRRPAASGRPRRPPVALPEEVLGLPEGRDKRRNKRARSSRATKNPRVTRGFFFIRPWRLRTSDALGAEGRLQAGRAGARPD